MTSSLSGAVLFSLGFVLLGATTPGRAEPLRQTIVENGIRVIFEAERVAADGRSESFQEGDAVRFRFTMTDSSGKAPIRGANTRAWLDLRREGDVPAAKAAEIKAS